MGLGEGGQELFAGPCQLHQDGARVSGIGGAADGTAALQAIDQFDGAVMLQKQAAGQFADRGRRSLRQALDGEQQLVLLRLQAGGAGLIFTELQELPQLVAELRESAVARCVEAVLFIHHLYRNTI